MRESYSNTGLKDKQYTTGKGSLAYIWKQQKCEVINGRATAYVQRNILKLAMIT